MLLTYSWEVTGSNLSDVFRGLPLPFQENSWTMCQIRQQSPSDAFYLLRFLKKPTVRRYVPVAK